MIKTAWKFDKLPIGDLVLLVASGGSHVGRQLAPDKDVLMKYKNGELTWEQFSQLYLEKIQHLWDTQNEAIRTVARFVKSKRTLWLTCWEGNNNPHCHRYLLKQFLDDHAET